MNWGVIQEWLKLLTQSASYGVDWLSGKLTQTEEENLETANPLKEIIFSFALLQEKLEAVDFNSWAVLEQSGGNWLSQTNWTDRESLSQLAASWQNKINSHRAENQQIENLRINQAKQQNKYQSSGWLEQINQVLNEIETGLDLELLQGATNFINWSPLNLLKQTAEQAGAEILTLEPELKYFLQQVNETAAVPAANRFLTNKAANSSSVVQQVQFSNVFQGEKAAQQNLAQAMQEAAGITTGELARALAYGR